MLSNAQISAKSVKMNIFYINIRRWALHFPQGVWMGYPAWTVNNITSKTPPVFATAGMRVELGDQY